MDRKGIIAQFIKETNLDQELAEDILAGTNWDLNAAVKEFNLMLHSGDRRLSHSSPSVPASSVSPSSKSESATLPSTSSKSGSTTLPSASKSRAKSGQMTRGEAVEEHDDVPPLPPKTDEGKKSLHRGFSQAQIEVHRPLKPERQDSHAVNYTLSFVLPDLTQFAPEFGCFIERELLDVETMKHLKKYGRLNWWSSCDACPALYAMSTSGDGNCLLHAASLAMWGFHDRQLVLRKALNKLLVDERSTGMMKKLQRRWKWQQMQLNVELGLVFTEEEWEEEWDGVLKLSSVQPRDMSKITGIYSSNSGGGSSSDEDDIVYESLEEFHVFVLAHILFRPVIIIADTVLRGVNDEPFAPIPFGGIYLPLERDPKDCCKTPVVLTYDASHFSALVAMENRKGGMPPVIPITDSERSMLPVHFSVDPGLSWQFNTDRNKNVEPLSAEKKLKLVQQYMDLSKIPSSAKLVTASAVQETLKKPYSQSRGPLSSLLKKGSTTKLSDVKDMNVIVGVVLSDKRIPAHENLVKSYIHVARQRFNKEMLTLDARRRQQEGPPSYYEIEEDLSPPVFRMDIGSHNPYDDPPPYREYLPGRNYTPMYEPPKATSKSDFRAILNDKTGMTHIVPLISPSYNLSTSPRSSYTDRRSPSVNSQREADQYYHQQSQPRSQTPSQSYNTARSPKVRHLPIAGEGPRSPQRSSPRKETARVRHVPIQVEQHIPPRRNSVVVAPATRQCRTQGCQFYGTEKMNFYCTKCFQRAHSQGVI